MKVTVDEERCCGAGTCVLLAPEVFDQREEDGIVLLLDQRPGEELHATVREAASVCPGVAISVDENS
ncbi:ferredoxin [Amycolatopsis rubida]|uniref:Ferredoxin n=1 Tax=Amycolatopsis rubida TaxID=112413 RepID=A0A1I5S3F5_9PSEU|nr:MULTISPECIES: ferredoxin [Amycolatopsis]MYW94926.1 ferredoxin [Amycolatopsis rubida]NEC59913.1 ferredoxin [Amycolatopsis rubida]OAP20642.1 Ferredoxin-2 [Amycolatopsis sp. M39]SFP65260.1 Ferredoxin [Amycolatopsis rubida]